MSRLRVPVGYAVGLIVLACARPASWALLCALPLALLGEGFRLWASGHIEKTNRLATGGPYAHTRNPLYFGSVLLAVSLAIATSAPIAIVAVTAYVAAFYPAVMRAEARFLAGRFPAEYADWARAVPLFFPRLRPAGPRATSFDWARVHRNREWLTVAAIPLATAILYARSRWPF